MPGKLGCVGMMVVGLVVASLASAEGATIASGEGAKAPQQPQVAVGDDGSVHLVYGVGDDVFYCRSDDGAKSFTSPVKLPQAYDIALGLRRGPRIAVAGDAICVTLIGGKQGKGRDGDLLALRSIDGGKTWAGPVVVNDVPDAAREGLHGMAAGPKGELCCVWLDLRVKGSRVMSAVSRDGGKTWSENRLVYSSPDGHVCPCCHPSVALDDEGNIVVMWRNDLAGNRDMYFATSSDGGRTFSQARKFGEGDWKLNICPMDGGSVVAKFGAGPASVWQREKTVFVTVADSPKEQKLGAGEQPWLAKAGDELVAVWVEKRGGALQIAWPLSARQRTLDSTASDPVIAARRNSNDGPVAAWEHKEGATTSIVCQSISTE